MSDDIRDYDFALPPELIAQEPAARREAARLLVVRREPGAGMPRFEDLLVSDLPQLVSEEKKLRDSLWVRNRSRVFPARFYAERASGGRHEIVLVQEKEPGVWEALVRRQARFEYPQKLRVAGKYEISSPAPGLIDFRGLGTNVFRFLEEVGEMPLPPYITQRDPARDRERYQPTWAQADKTGSAAAPTASLHFTPELCQTLETKGVSFTDLYLHVGLGTFEPLRQNSLSAHELHRERFEVPLESTQILEGALQKQRPLLCVGTTALRTLESLGLNGHAPHPLARVQKGPQGEVTGDTQLFVRPGFEFRYAQTLLTNFHLPQSTLLVLVSTFCGSRSLCLDAYQHAVNKKYRFFSFGDASLWL